MICRFVSLVKLYFAVVMCDLTLDRFFRPAERIQIVQLCCQRFRRLKKNNKMCVIHRTGADAEIHTDRGCHGNGRTACRSHRACEVIYMRSEAGVMPECK